MRGIETLLITALVSSMVMAALSLGLPAPAPAQVVKAGIVTTLRGTATVARGTADQAPLRFRDDVYVEDRITTGDESLARILLGGKAVVTVRERSQLKITETALTSTIEITGGKIALAVDKSRMKPGESVEIRTPNAVAAIRGTIIMAEVEAPAVPGHDVATRFTLLTGIVDVTLLDPSTGRASGLGLTLKPMQTVGITGSTPPSAPRSLSRAEAQAIAGGYAVPSKSHPRAPFRRSSTSTSARPRSGSPTRNARSRQAGPLTSPATTREPAGAATRAAGTPAASAAVAMETAEAAADPAAVTGITAAAITIADGSDLAPGSPHEPPGSRREARDRSGETRLGIDSEQRVTQ